MARVGGQRMTDDALESMLEVLARVSVGDLDARVDVDPSDLDDPMGLVANALNVVLEDLAYRQQEREAALRRVAALEAKDELLASLSHDMRTPLAIIQGAVEVLGTDPDRSEVAQILPLMDQATGRLQRFVQQFLDLARLNADREVVVQPTVVDVVEQVDRSVALFAGHGPVPVDVLAPVPAVVADPERLEQILTNLLVNAFTHAADPEVQVGPQDDGVAVVVADRGPGISDVDLDRVFAKFERGPSPTSGSGLGLFIGRQLAEAMGGRLTATSVPGRGSRFRLWLPSAVPTGDQSPP